MSTWTRKNVGREVRFKYGRNFIYVYPEGRTWWVDWGTKGYSPEISSSFKKSREAALDLATRLMLEAKQWVKN